VRLKYYAAVREALAGEMRRDPTTLLIGEDVGVAGGIFAQTKGLLEEFGPERVRDAPAGEAGYMGVAVGCAMTGLRPIVEISFADFFMTCMDPLVNQAAKIRYMSGGQTAMPITITAFGGAGLNAGPQHSGSHEAWLGSIPGIKVVAPSGSRDVLGLMRSAVRDDNPVVVLLHKGLLQAREEVEDGDDHAVPIGSAAVRREGEDLTLVSFSAAVRTALAAADELAERGISAEVVDLRSIQPVDWETVLGSVRKTRRAVVVQESFGFMGVGAEIAARVGRDAFGVLAAPVERVAAPFGHVPFSKPLEAAYLPQVEDVIGASLPLVGAGSR
jgi:pyruvate/2-oxoglutarate/acetoin dehydrogenase E1 component